MNIADNCVVSIHYTLTDDEGNVIDSSVGGQPLTYLHGAENIIPGLENALTGHTAGTSLKLSVQPEDGYGPSDPELIQTFPKEAFSGIENIEEGMEFQAQAADGRIQYVMVKHIGENEITVDGNHVLAGKVLHFDVTIEDVRAADEDEIAHGHVH